MLFYLRFFRTFLCCIGPEHDLTDHHHTNYDSNDLYMTFHRANHVFAYTTFHDTYRKRSAFSYIPQNHHTHRMVSASGVLVFITLIRLGPLLVKDSYSGATHL